MSDQIHTDAARRILEAINEGLALGQELTLQDIYEQCEPLFTPAAFDLAAAALINAGDLAANMHGQILSAAEGGI